MKKNFFTKGFTLIEVLVVISIIGVLTAVLLANMAGARQRAADAKLKNDLRQLKTGLRLYYNDNQEYPTESGGLFVGCGAGGGTGCSVGDVFGTATDTYMSSVPEYTYYQQTNSGDGFVIGVDLSNESDSDIATSQAKCQYGAESTTLFVVCAD